MAEQITFPVRLTKDDWQAELKAWRCPALAIPGAKIEDAFDAEGIRLSTKLLRAETGPARVSYWGPGPQPPARIVVVIGLSEELSPSSEGRFWKRLAIVVPIITALITGAITLWTREGPNPTAHVLRLRVDPIESEASVLPPPRILVNSREEKQPIEHKMTSDVIAIIDVSKAIDAAKALRAANVSQQETLANQQATLANARAGIQNLAKNLQPALAALDALNKDITGDVCSGRDNGQPIFAPARARMVENASKISGPLRGLNSDLLRLIPPN